MLRRGASTRSAVPSSLHTEEVVNTTAEEFAAVKVTTKRRSNSAPLPTTGRRKQLIEDHYIVDTKAKVVLPGLIKYENDWVRDCHDFFNLIVLVREIIRTEPFASQLAHAH